MGFLVRQQDLSVTQEMKGVDKSLPPKCHIYKLTVLINRVAVCTIERTCYLLFSPRSELLYRIISWPIFQKICVTIRSRRKHKVAQSRFKADGERAVNGRSGLGLGRMHFTGLCEEIDA